MIRTRTLALALFALYLPSGLALVVGKALRRLGRAASHARESPLEARRRVYGVTYTDAVAALRRAIPRDGTYGLVDGDGDPRLGTAFWLRFDLAPRRAIDLGRAADRRPAPAGLRWIVLTRGKEPPLLLPAEPR